MLLMIIEKEMLYVQTVDLLSTRYLFMYSAILEIIHTQKVGNARPLLDELFYKLQVDNQVILRGCNLLEQNKVIAPTIPLSYLCAIAIYNSLKLEGVYRALDQIALVCNVSQRRFWKYLQQLPQTTLVDAEARCEFILASLELTFEHIVSIRKLLKTFPCSGNSKKTLIAASAYSYLKFINKKVTIEEIGKAANVNQGSLNRCLSYLKAEKWTISRALASSRKEV